MEIKRKEIDEIDKKIKNLLLERKKRVEFIGDYKRKNMIDILDSNREDEILKSLTSDLSPKDKAYLEEIYKQIFTSSKNLQK